MTNLAHRAEQAALGALLTDRSRVRDVTLAVRDFTDPRHQAIYAAIRGTVARERGLLAGLRGWLRGLAARSRTREAAAYMTSLPAACPDPGNLSSYAKMVAEASQQRDLVAQAAANARETGQLAGAAAWLEGQAERIAANADRLHITGHAGEDAASMSRDVARLARALQHKIDGLAHATGAPTGVAAPSAGIPAQPQPSWPEASSPAAPEVSARGAAAPAIAAKGRGPAESSGMTPDPGGPQRAAGQAPGPISSGDLQDLVLADLLQRPRNGEHAAGWLPAAVFTPGPRRELFEVIRARIGSGQPTDALIIAWEISKRPAPDREPGGAAAEEPPGRSLDAEYVLHAGALDAAPGTADVLGRALLADHVCTRRFGPDWMRAPQITGTATRPAASPDPDPQGETQVQAKSRAPEAEAAVVAAGLPSPVTARAGNGAAPPAGNAAPEPDASAGELADPAAAETGSQAPGTHSGGLGQRERRPVLTPPPGPVPGAGDRPGPRP
jgi:DnaB-like helicase N terminal domain